MLLPVRNQPQAEYANNTSSQVKIHHIYIYTHPDLFRSVLHVKNTFRAHINANSQPHVQEKRKPVSQKTVCKTAFPCQNKWYVALPYHHKTLHCDEFSETDNKYFACSASRQIHCSGISYMWH